MKTRNNLLSILTKSLSSLFVLWLFFTAFPTHTHAQTYQYVPMPDSGAIWSEKWREYEVSSIYQRYTVCGDDTIINGIKYNKLYVFYDSVFNKNTAVSIGGIREDSLKRVLFKSNGIHDATRNSYHMGYDTITKEIILYDFSMKQRGDTMHLAWGTEAWLVINNIDTLLIDGIYRRKISFGSSMYWIEGIGSTRGLFWTIPVYETGGTDNELICFIQNNKVLYHNNSHRSCLPTYRYVPMPDSGAIWSEVSWMTGGYPDSITVCRYAVNGEDTLIKNKLYNKLYLFYDSIFDKKTAQCIGGIREDKNKRVYCSLNSQNSTDILLYDFSMNIGDSMLVNINVDKPEWVFVVSIDTFEIGNELRKYIGINIGKEYYGRASHYWIEGIGNVEGLLASSGSVPNGYFSKLNCFIQYNELIYAQLEGSLLTCFPTSSINKINNKIVKEYHPVQVFPNPTIGSINFDFKETPLCESIMIFNIHGVLVKLVPVNGQVQLSVPLTGYQSGIYFYKAITKNGMQYTGKFVVL